MVLENIFCIQIFNIFLMSFLPGSPWHMVSVSPSFLSTSEV